MKIDYSNLDKVEIRYDLGKGELNGRLTIMSKRDQKEMIQTINLQMSRDALDLLRPAWDLFCPAPRPKACPSISADLPPVTVDHVVLLARHPTNANFH